MKERDRDRKTEREGEKRMSDRKERLRESRIERERLTERTEKKKIVNNLSNCE